MDVEAGHHILSAEKIQSISASMAENHSIPQRIIRKPQGFPGNGMGFCADNLRNQLSPNGYPYSALVYPLLPAPISERFSFVSIWYPTHIHRVIHRLTYHRDICCADTTQISTILHNYTLYYTLLHFHHLFTHKHSIRYAIHTDIMEGFIHYCISIYLFICVVTIGAKYLYSIMLVYFYSGNNHCISVITKSSIYSL